MRQFIVHAMLCSLLLPGAAGCRSVMSTQVKSDQPASSSSDAKIASQPATKPETDRIRQVEFESGDIESTPVSLMGIDWEETNNELALPPLNVILPPHVAATSETEVEMLNVIEVGRDPTSEQPPRIAPLRVDTSLDSNWGHTQVSDLPPISEPFCPECNNPATYTPLPYTQQSLCAGGCGYAQHAIRVGDELEIKFPHKPLFSEKIIVREDGMIAVPLIEPVMAAGLTPEGLQSALQEKYRALQYNPLLARQGRIEKKYLLSVNDKLEVRFDSDNANVDSKLGKLNDSVTVRPDGRISLPLIGTLQAEGKTPEELEKEIVSRYREFHHDALPVLIVREFTNDRVLVDGRMTRTGLKDIDDVVVLTRTFERMVYVGGEVAKPGLIRFKGPMTVSQAIIAAGGPIRTAELRTVARFREGMNCQAVGELIDIKTQWRYEKTKKLSVCERPPVSDVLLGANDVVIVPKTRIAKVNDALDQYVYQLIPMTRNTQFQYLYTSGSAVGAFGF